MSQNAVKKYKHSLEVPASTPSAPQLRPLRPVTNQHVRSARPKMGSAIVLLAGVLSVVAAQLLLSVGISEGAYELSSLTRAQKHLIWEKEIVANNLKEISSPQFLAANAQALGMVIDGTPAYLRLSDAAVVGVPAASTAQGDVVMGSSSLVGNSLINGLPMVTVPDLNVPGSTGESTVEEPPATISLENGIPAPQTH